MKPIHIYTSFFAELIAVIYSNSIAPVKPPCQFVITTNYRTCFAIQAICIFAYTIKIPGRP